MKYYVNDIDDKIFFSGRAKTFNHAKKKISKELRRHHVYDKSNYYACIDFKLSDLIKFNISIKEDIENGIIMKNIYYISRFYKIPEWELLNQDIFFMNDIKGYEDETSYDFYTKPEIKPGDIVRCKFDNHYYVVVRDLSNPWGFNFNKFFGGNVYPSGLTWDGVSQYYIEKVNESSIDKSLLSLLKILYNKIINKNHIAYKEDTIQLHKDICEAEGIEFDGII